MKAIIARFSVFIISFCLLFFLSCSFSNGQSGSSRYADVNPSLQKDLENWEQKSTEEKLAYLGSEYYLGYAPADTALLGLITGEKRYFSITHEMIEFYKNNYTDERGGYVRRSKLRQAHGIATHLVETIDIFTKRIFMQEMRIF